MKPPAVMTLAALVMLGGISTGQAATVIDTGPLEMDQEVLINSGVRYAPPGRYKFTLDFSPGAILVYGDLIKDINYNFYCDFHDGTGLTACGGDNVPEVTAFKAVSPTRYEATVQVNAPYSVYDTTLIARTDFTESCCEVNFDVYSDRIGTYKLSFGAVPEPATWGLMIIGMGGVGLAMRRRRSVQMDNQESRVPLLT